MNHRSAAGEWRRMVRLKFDIELKYEIAEQASDFMFNIHAAHKQYQIVVSESLRIDQSLKHSKYADAPDAVTCD